ncbi:MAG: 2-phosphosulfolactate phosphatase [Candidatus Hydrogenedentes bacterium]|nr:2-phosphosulfolactate phosphatase [Candidatus Hydrogenedentota bacterium]
MKCHLIEGAEGCAFAVENHCVAVVVDALRASAMAACLLDAGVTEILAVREVEEAYAAKRLYPEALLAGERGGVPPLGFDLGNSPRQIRDVAGRRVIFTTTTGAGRLVACWGAHAIYMGTTVNASAVAREAASHGHDIVLIPAGLMTDPRFDAQEDWIAATAIARILGIPVGQGEDRFTHWGSRIEAEGLEALFQSAPHAEKLRRVNLEEDIPFCAALDRSTSVPKVVEKIDLGLVVRKA